MNEPDKTINLTLGRVQSLLADVIMENDVDNLDEEVVLDDFVKAVILAYGSGAEPHTVMNDAAFVLSILEQANDISSGPMVRW